MFYEHNMAVNGCREFGDFLKVCRDFLICHRDLRIALWTISEQTAYCTQER